MSTRTRDLRRAFNAGYDRPRALCPFTSPGMRRAFVSGQRRWVAREWRPLRQRDIEVRLADLATCLGLPAVHDYRGLFRTMYERGHHLPAARFRWARTSRIESLDGA